MFENLYEEYTEEMGERITKIKEKLLKEEEKILQKENLSLEEYNILKDRLICLENVKNFSKSKKEQVEKKQALLENMLKVL